jgi:hypothetical protein
MHIFSDEGDCVKVVEFRRIRELQRYKESSIINNAGILRKEVIQPHLPIRLPCYDLAPVIGFTFGVLANDFGCPQLPWLDGRCVQGPGTYSP